jgi:hypothetical protein
LAKNSIHDRPAFGSTRVITLAVLSLLALSTFVFAFQFAGINSHPFASAQAIPPISNWHEGTNVSTSQVDVSYFEHFTEGPTTYSNQSNDIMVGDMVFNYPDGTGEMVLFGLTYTFAPGGLNMTTNQVLNWSKVTTAGVSYNTWSNVNGTPVSTLYTFTGFDIVNGSANDFNLTRNNGPNDSFYYNIKNIIGSLNYENSSSITIGAVSLSTANTTYAGQTLTESIAKFNITLEAQISDLPLPPEPPSLGNFTASSVPVPVVMMFTITHDTAQTEIKYGLDVNWSAVQAFPTAAEFPNNPNPFSPGALKTGDNFSLVAQDRLDFGYTAPGGMSSTVATFSTDSANDSAIYVVNGTELCRELFATNYTAIGNPQVYNTTRVYLPISWQSTWNQSSMFVVIGGFQYNESSGFVFDPAVIMPNSVSQSIMATSTSAGTSNGQPGVSSSVTGSNAQSSSGQPSEAAPFPIVTVVSVAGVIGAIVAGSLLFSSHRKSKH